LPFRRKSKLISGYSEPRDNKRRSLTVAVQLLLRERRGAHLIGGFPIDDINRNALLAGAASLVRFALDGDHRVEIRLGRGDKAIDGAAIQCLEQQALAVCDTPDTPGGSHFRDLEFGLLLDQQHAE